MRDVTWTHPALPLILNMIPVETNSLVDVGSGRGILGALCRIYREPKRLVCVEKYLPSLSFSKDFRFYDEYLHWDLERVPLPFKDREFETAVCIEVIEHLPKDCGRRLLDELERIAGRIVISTPNFLYDQPEFDDNPYQKHLSYWAPGEFRKRGYRVYGIGDMKVLNRRIRFVSSGLRSLTKYLPSVSTLLLCVKDSGGKGTA